MPKEMKEKYYRQKEMIEKGRKKIQARIVDNKQNPLLGEWRLNYNGCLEINHFYESGILITKSHEEIIKRSYSFKEKEAPVYILETKPIETNGLESCSGTKTTIDGHRPMKIFVKFRNEHQNFYMSFDRNDHTKNHLGPFYKKVD